MDTPIRTLQTAWGTLYATAHDGGTVRFRTVSPNPEDPGHYLTLNRLWYSSNIELSMGEPKRSGRHYVDDVWHVDLTDVSYRIGRHPGGGPATPNALRVVRDEVLPELASWLHTPDGVSLLKEGSSYKLASCVEQADVAEQVLHRALDRVRRIKSSLSEGVSPSTDSEAFLGFVAHDVNFAVQRGEVPSASFRPAIPPVDHPTRGPEPPGL